MTRITERFRYDTTNARLQSIRNIADQAQETAISGRKLHQISDDPVGATKVLRNKEKLENIGQYRKTLDFCRGFLGKTEDALRSINDVLIRAKELSIQQANATWDPDSRAIVAQEIRQLGDHLVSLGNSTYSDRYVFGGFKTAQPPLSADGTYSGDDGVIYVQMEDEGFRPINVSGRDIFEVPVEKEGRDLPLVQVMRHLYSALTHNDMNELYSSMSRLDESSQKIMSAVAVVGSRRTAVEDIAQRLDISEENMLLDNVHLESADPVKSALDLKRTETALQTSLAVSGKILSPSLMDFLK